MARRYLAVALLAVCFCLVALACAKREAGPPQAEPVVPAPAPAAAADDTNQGAAPQKPISQKLIRDAELDLEVDAYETTRPVIDARLAAVKGYVALARVDHQEGGVSSAELELRVPAAKLDAFIAECINLGTVRHQSVRARDVTEEYYDAVARLANARKLEARYLELVETKTESVKDLLEVERELGRVREQIETIEGKLRLFDSQVAMSKVVLRITTRDRFTAGKSATLGEQISRTFSRSVATLLLAGRGLLLICVALAPWAAILGMVLLGGYLLRRWLTTRRAGSTRRE